MNEITNAKRPKDDIVTSNEGSFNRHKIMAKIVRIICMRYRFVDTLFVRNGRDVRKSVITIYE